MTTTRSKALLGLPVLLSMVGCATSVGGPPESTEAWLAGKGFDQRGDWDSAVLHLRGPQMRGHPRISDLIRGIGEVRIRPGPANPLGLTRVRDGGRPPCALGIFLNGVPLVPRDPKARYDLDGRVGVAELDALELHLGPNGPAYDPEGCGSLLLWDRSMRHVDDPAFVGSIRGRVVGEWPEAGIEVRIGPEGVLQRVAASGSFSFTGLLPGEYELEFVVLGQTVHRHIARIYAGAASEVEIPVAGREAPASSF